MTVRNATRERRVAQGLCARCGSPNPREATECADCAKKRVLRTRDLQEARREAWICLYCGSADVPAGLKTPRCTDCRDRARAKERTRKQQAKHNGLCIQCKQRKADTGCLCKQCWNYRATTPTNMRHALSVKRSRCKRRNIEFDLTEDHLLRLWEAQSGNCFWLGIPLTSTPERNRYAPTKPTLDRLIPERGYVEGNVVWSSNFANRGRCNTSVDAFTEFLEALGIKRTPIPASLSVLLSSLLD